MAIMTIDSPAGAIEILSLTTKASNFPCAILGEKLPCFVLSDGMFSSAKITASVYAIAQLHAAGMALNSKDALLAVGKNKQAVKSQKTCILAGKLISGASGQPDPIEQSVIFIANKSLVVSKWDGTGFPALATIPFDDIKNIEIEDASTIESRVTATRLLTMGLFAFAKKKKEKNELYYLCIPYTLGKFESELVFEYEGKESSKQANSVRDLLISSINAA